jgi:hypothetical protein
MGKDIHSTYIKYYSTFLCIILYRSDVVIYLTIVIFSQQCQYTLLPYIYLSLQRRRS